MDQASISDHVLLNPVISITNRYLRLLGIEVPRSVVRRQLSLSPEFPFLGLSSLKAAFGAWDIPNVALKVEPEGLDDLPLPAVVVIEEGRESEKQRPLTIFAILKAVSSRETELTHPILGDHTLLRSAFLDQWTGLAFLAEPSWRREARFHDDTIQERLDDEAYSHSIETIPGFFSQEECRYLVNYCELNEVFSSSGVLSTIGQPIEVNRLVKTRTSHSAFLPDRNNDIFKRIYERVACKLGVSETAVENLQCVRYLPGQEFKPHYDASNDIPRTFTLLVYLNDDFTGGETYFPEVSLTITPKAGTALLFRNLDDDMSMIPQSLHAGLPVQSGVKYACNIWIRALARPQSE